MKKDGIGLDGGMDPKSLAAKGKGKKGKGKGEKGKEGGKDKGKGKGGKEAGQPAGGQVPPPGGFKGLCSYFALGKCNRNPCPFMHCSEKQLKRAMSGGRGEKGGDDDGGKGGNKKGGSRGNSKGAKSRNNSSGKKKGEGKNAAPAAADPAELERRLNQLQSRPQLCRVPKG